MGSDWCMHVIRRTNQHRIDFGVLIQHNAVVSIGLGFLTKRRGPILVQSLRQSIIVYITDSIDVLMRYRLNI